MEKKIKHLSIYFHKIKKKLIILRNSLSSAIFSKCPIIILHFFYLEFYLLIKSFKAHDVFYLK